MERTHRGRGQFATKNTPGFLERRENVEKSKPRVLGIARMELDVPAAAPRPIAMRSHAAVALDIS